MLRLLRQPYPTEESVRRWLIRAFLIGAFVGFFLLVFQPFGLYEWQTPAKTLKILGFGLVTFFVLTADSFILPLLFPRYFSNERWTVGHEIVRTLLFIIVIAIGNRLYLGWLIREPSIAHDWLAMIGMTFIIGLFPTVGGVLTSYIVQLRRYSRVAAELPHHSPPSAPGEPWLQERVSTVRANDAPDTLLTLVADNEKDKLILRANTLLFIESSDNYSTVVCLKSNATGIDQPVKPLLRSSLSRLEGQINQPHIVRSHRSYIVNLDRVERVTGNAQGYKLHLLGGQFQVPVARRFNDGLIVQLKSLTP
ncbi:LytR/AlgR family response regulator transcription factor [Spirosoma arcticum]